MLVMAVSLTSAAPRMQLWVIDPGHGGRDVGCEGSISREKDITLAIAKEVGRLVKENIPGVKVVYTRERDTYPTLAERCELANRRGADLFLSIHVNDAPNKFASGTESYYAENVPKSGANVGKSELLALLLQREYLAGGRKISRGVKQERLYVCEYTYMPCVLTEVGFISNMEEELYMVTSEGQKALAHCIYEALKAWKEMTASGTCDMRKLRNLRYAYMDPRRTKSTTQVTVVEPKKPAEPEPQQVAEPAPAPVQEKPQYSVQIMTLANVIKGDDPRLKGMEDVRFLPADGRYKLLVGTAQSYHEASNLCSLVREKFPDAFVVAYLGDKQITTAEAMELEEKAQPAPQEI